MSFTIRTQTTLSLKRISPEEVGKRYLEGAYSNKGISKVDPSTKTGFASIPIFEKGAPVHTFRDKNNAIVQFAIVNPTPEGETRHCEYCELPYKGQGFGTPISISFEESPDGSRTKTYTITDCYNTLECMYTDYKRHHCDSVMMRRSHRIDSEPLIRQMIYDYTGSYDIRDAYNPKFLKTKGGAMSPEEYLKGTHQYIPVPHIGLRHVSGLYLKVAGNSK